VRLSELDLEVLRLGARLNALEAHQVAADRARALAPEPSTNPLANAASGAKPTAPPPTPNTQPRTDRPSYGIQLASLKNTDQVQQFIAEHAIDPRQVRVVQTGNRVLLIHGLFTDRGQSGATIPSLPQSLRRQGPIIHTFAPGEPPPPLAGGDQPLTTDQRQ
jgi:septal ring-binding cell division protein DamX